MIIKTFKLIIASSLALLFSLITLNNVTNYEANFSFVQLVLSMEHVEHTNVLWRAITTPWIQHSIYIAIIIWELLITLVCWMGLLRMIKGPFSKGKRYVLVGLMMGFALFMFGFVIIGGEWFYMWSSSALDPAHLKAIVLSLLFATLFYIMALPIGESKQN